MALVKISRCNDVLFETWANGEGNITSLASAIRTVQKESNEFLTKLVEKEKSSNTDTERNAGNKHEEEEDEDEDSDEDKADKEDRGDAKEEEAQKRRNSSKSSLSNAKKFCQSK